MRQLLLLLLLAPCAYAADDASRVKNAATRVCGTIWTTSGIRLAEAVTGIDCEYAVVTDGTNESAYTDLGTAEAVVGTAGQFCAPITASEINIDGDFRVYCSATNTGATAWEKILTTRGQFYDGATLAEGTSTIDLEASEISSDNQFAGNELLLFSTAGKFYFSSCIASSTNANERVTLAADPSALHTVGDYYIIKANAACLGNLFIDTEVAAIKAKTDNLPSDPADQSAVETAISAVSSSSRKGQR